MAIIRVDTYSVNHGILLVEGNKPCVSFLRWQESIKCLVSECLLLAVGQGLNEFEKANLEWITIVYQLCFYFSYRTESVVAFASRQDTKVGISFPEFQRRNMRIAKATTSTQ